MAPMMKRVVWLAAGATMGAVGSQWVQRKVKRKLATLAPPAIASKASGTVKGLGRDLRSVMSEGRHAMREREVELRTELESRLHR
jgi:hypothetical protein